jgi:lipopolysaccharide biosynthesis regulator YciM
MENYAVLLAGLVALLIGLTVGKAWERYKLVEGRWVDRRRARESPHYILGLNFLVANQIDLAIEEFNKAARLDEHALEIHLILGNLYREKGQVGRAIQEHQALLQRPRLTRLQHANVLLCLGLDYKRGGFVDRALEAFTEVLRFDPQNEYALVNLQKLHEEQHQWREAHATRQRVAKLIGPGDRPRNHAILAFLENELGLEALKRADEAEAAQHFEAAIDLDASTAPAYLNLGDVRLRRGRAAEAAEIWERLVHVSPERAYLAFERLESAYSTIGAPERFPDLCRRLIAANGQDWRARRALARHFATQGQRTEALELLLEALVHNPHALALHQAIWQTLLQLGLPAPLVSRYTELAHDAIFYLDPHVCMRCRYRSTELLWQCPHCHEWNTFVEERIAPAKDGEELPAGLAH